MRPDRSCHPPVRTLNLPTMSDSPTPPTATAPTSAPPASSPSTSPAQPPVNQPHDRSGSGERIQSVPIRPASAASQPDVKPGSIPGNTPASSPAPKQEAPPAAEPPARKVGQFVIEKGLAIPPVGPPKREAEFGPVLKALEVGDSFVVESEKGQTIRSTAKNLKIQVAIRKHEKLPGMIRVWRTADVVKSKE
jgi:hypothetical protein